MHINFNQKHEHINLWGHRWQWTMIHGCGHTYLKMADTMREIPALNCGSGERLKTNSKNKMWSRSGKHTPTPTRNHCVPLCMKLLFNKSQWSKTDKLKQSNAKDSVHSTLTYQEHTSCHPIEGRKTYLSYINAYIYMLEKYRTGWGKKEKLYHSYPNRESICLSAKRNVHIANF